MKKNRVLPTPTTGVVNNNSVEWLNDELFDAICLECEDAIEIHGDSIDYSEDCEACKEWESYCIDFLECSGDHTLLIGSWIKNEDGLYEPDTSNEYAAIVRECVTQVVYSKWARYCRMCSPCYPFQGDLDTPGSDYFAYDLPPDLYGENKPENIVIL